MTKRPMIIISLLILVLFVGIYGYGALSQYMRLHQYLSHRQPAPATISTTRATRKSWHPEITSVGTLVSVNGVDLSTEVSGTVENILFKSGQYVTKGQPLFKLDDQTDLEDLKNYRAQLKLAEVDYQRQLTLFRKKVAAKSNLDTTKAKLEQAQALLSKTEAVIAKKTIVAPFSGMLGIRHVNLGQYISPGTNLVTLQSLDPMYVEFNLPEQYLSDIKLGYTVNLHVDTYPNNTYTGKISAINAKVNQATHNVLLQASIANAKHELYPGMFANLTVVSPKTEQAVMVPQTAITYNLYGNAIYVVEEAKDNSKNNHTHAPRLIAKQRFVVIGRRHGNDIIIKEGVQPGDEVVTVGQMKLHPNSPVVVNNRIKLTHKTSSEY